MNDALLIPLLLALAAISMAVIAGVARGIWREMHDGDADAEDGSITERRKNDKIPREIEQWREGK
ncbi:MAG: hypothetical protein MUC40_06915 [Akkermansiaceae bacterium]|nr:hypothetical protein [Akkermansiaceae bacterium]